MPFQSAPLTAAVKCMFSLNSGEKNGSFTLYSKKASVAWNITTLAQLAASVKAAMEDSYIPALSDQHTFLGVVARDLANEFPVFVEDMEAVPVAGDLASPALPSNVSVVVTWLGAAGSAPRQGRINLLSPTEAQVTNSLLTGGAHSTLEGVATALRASVEDPSGVADASQAIVSRYSGRVEVGERTNGKKIYEEVKRATAVVNGVTDFRIGSRLDTQKKRLPRE